MGGMTIYRVFKDSLKSNCKNLETLSDILPNVSMCLDKDIIILLQGEKEMLKSKMALFLAVLLVLFVGLTLVAFVMVPDGIILAKGAEIMGHVCGSTCAI